MFWKLCRRPLSTGTGHCFLVHFFKRNTLVPIIQFQKEHGGAAFIAPEGVIAESMEDGRTPFIKAAQDMMFFTGELPETVFCRYLCSWHKYRHNVSFWNVFPGYAGSNARWIQGQEPFLSHTHYLHAGCNGKWRYGSEKEQISSFRSQGSHTWLHRRMDCHNWSSCPRFRLRKYVDGGYKPFLRNGL